MNKLKSFTLIVFVATTGTLCSAEFSKEKIQHYAGYVRMTSDVRSYIRDLPPEAINQLVDQLDFNKDGRGENTFFFSFTCMKAKELEAAKIAYDKDYVFSKLTSFVRSAIAKGDVGIGGGAMNSLSRFDHPEILKLAKELSESKDELTQSNAKLLLKKHEQREKSRGNRSVSSWQVDSPSTPMPKSNSPNPVTAASTTETSSWNKWPIILAVAFVLSAMLIWLKAKSRA